MENKRKALAATIYAGTIQAYYTRGVEPGTRLNFEQIAGESIEAALRFEAMTEREDKTGSVTKVMQLNDAHRDGYIAFMQGMPKAAPETLSDELQASWKRGWLAAEKEVSEGK